ncbi:MAG TPA: cytochrome c oxidase subunit II [Acidimicrobiales bacterium]|nr:cytochrome c oxidase subunit II [Acidimicrobiales bacterium]
MTGCAETHSMLHPHGPDAGRIANLTWFMLIVAGAITAVVFVLMVVGLYRKGRGATSASRRLIMYGGVALPAVVLGTLSVMTVFTLHRTESAAAQRVQIEVIGHQFWWEVRYPGTGAVTANEIHVPVGEEVDLTLRSDDVIHSLWVPALAQKVDMIPGRTNHLALEATHPGTYRGQCAEFCGVEHAQMIFQVVAQPPAAFHRWLAHQAAPAAAPASPAARAGRAEFLSQACAGCHTVRGTPAHGSEGPDLTHVADRAQLAAGAIPNDPDSLRRWIGDAQAIKPGALMPEMPIGAHELDLIAAYVEALQ